MTVLTDGRVLTPAGILERGWLRVDGRRISEVGSGASAAEVERRIDLGGRLVVPGWIDLHVHGGGGHSMLSADPAEIEAAAAFHLRHGTTRTLASIVTAPLDEMLAAVDAVRRCVATSAPGGPCVLGSHLEGPFLNPARAGAHDPRFLLPPDIRTFDRFLDAAGGTLRVITVAPELPGGLELVRHAVASGVVVALGHSDADHDQARAAFEAGATLVTHLFNGMRPWHHRDPGLVGAALTHSGVALELVNDGLHVHDATGRAAYAAAGSGRIALVTDAIAAAGVGDGAFRLGPAAVRVRGGAVHVDKDGTLAGSTLTLEVALQRAVRLLGVPVEAAVESASTVPARVLGIPAEVGSLSAGLAADLVVLGDDLEVQGVMTAGEWTGSGRLFHT